MEALRDLGHGKAECSLRPRSVCPSLCRTAITLPPPSPRRRFLSLFLFWQRITGGFEQISRCGLQPSGKTEPALRSEDPPRRRVCESAYLHVVFGVAPVPLGVQVAQVKALLLAEVDFCHGSADLSCDKVCT